MSCNGCRVLRKRCTESCTIKPCLQWISTAQSQANATLFLAKFYGRTDLINLINAGVQNLRPEIFKSLLFEACGRMVDPIHGSIGLMCSGNWHLCQTAVDAVLSGKPILSASNPPLTCDIRHVSKNKKSDDGLCKVKSRRRFKASASKRKPKMEEVYELVNSESELNGGLSLGEDGGGKGDSLSVEASLADELGCDLELELTLGVGCKTSLD